MYHCDLYDKECDGCGECHERNEKLEQEREYVWDYYFDNFRDEEESK